MIRARLPAAARAAAARPGARRLASALVLAALAAVAFAAPARAGTFRVSQCNAVDAAEPSPRTYQDELWSVANGWPAVECGVAGGTIRIGTAAFRLAENQNVTTSFTIPPSMPGTTLRTAWIDWHFNAQAPSTNPAFMHIRGGGAVVLTARAGEGSAPGAATRREIPTGSRRIAFEVWCSTLNGPGWCNWPAHALELRGMTVALEEQGAPSAAAGGRLLAAGPHGGVEPLEVVATDADSGVDQIAVSLAGEPVGVVRPAGGCRDDRLPPCPQALRGTLDVDTRAVADGLRALRLVVTDAAGNERTVDAGLVDVRNQPAFTPPGAGISPVTGTARTGTRALFPANPLAGRGHAANGTHADEQAWLDAWLEPRGTRARRRHALTVRAGVRVRIRGRLADRRGRPIARAALAAVRREPGGPWKAVTGVRTRPNGRFTMFTRLGPSQELRFAYYAFGDSIHAQRSPLLRVRVRRE